MQDKSPKMLAASLEQMRQYCKDINTLLNEDKTHFSSNNLISLDESNKTKMAIIEKLTSLANEMTPQTAHQPANIFDTIEKNISTFDDQARNDINKMMMELKAEIHHCYQSLLLNSQVVFINILQMKDLWDKLLATKKQLDVVYDNKGNATC